MPREKRGDYRIREKSQMSGKWYVVNYYDTLKEAKKALTPYRRKFHKAIIQKRFPGNRWLKIYPKD